MANAAANSITAYALPAQGNVAPTRTISGPVTGLSNPAAIAVDPAGHVVVANANGLVEVFPDGANGNVRASKTFPTQGTPDALAVDPFNGDIYVATPGSVGVFSPSGLLLRSISNFSIRTFNTPYYFLGLAIDNKDELITGFNVILGREVCESAIALFAPNAGGNDSPISQTVISPCSS